MPMAHVLGKRNKISFENNFESNPVVVFIPGMNNLSQELSKLLDEPYIPQILRGGKSHFQRFKCQKGPEIKIRPARRFPEFEGPVTK